MIKAALTNNQASLIRDSMDWFKKHFLKERHKHLLDHISGLSAVEEFFSLNFMGDRLKETFRYKRRLGIDVDDEDNEVPIDIELDEDLLPLLKRILLEKRRYEAERVQRAIAKTHNANLIMRFESELTPFDDLLQTFWLREMDVGILPRPADFLSVQIIVDSQAAVQRPTREYDEKFHILQAPKLILEDLRYYRNVCDVREVPVTVAYLDIDDFKRLNSKHTEVQIDRRVLPRFMQVLEEHVFEHGYAYRQGGDEYVVIVPNLDASIAAHFFDVLRRRVAELKYPGVDENTTISTGVCTVPSNCFLTDGEILARANEAKNFAKMQGKNCVATYTDANLTQLQITSY